MLRGCLGGTRQQYAGRRSTFLWDLRDRDGKYILPGSIELSLRTLIEKAGLDREEFAPQMNQSEWPKLRSAY